MNNRRVIPVPLVLVLVAAFAATTVFAAPAPGGPAAPVCSQTSASYALGVDGGLTGLSRGEIVVDVPKPTSPRPLGVDGGVLSLLFAPSEGSSFAASTGNACTGI